MAEIIDYEFERAIIELLEYRYQLAQILAALGEDILPIYHKDAISYERCAVSALNIFRRTAYRTMELYIRDFVMIQSLEYEIVIRENSRRSQKATVKINLQLIPDTTIGLTIDVGDFDVDSLTTIGHRRLLNRGFTLCWETDGSMRMRDVCGWSLSSMTSSRLTDGVASNGLSGLL